jgi:misacylated tRNA(Ala) deacylase
MSVKLYWKDAYSKEFDAEVRSVRGSEVELDATAFYPTGGGVQHDTGTISSAGASYKVVEVRKEGETILHRLDSEPALSQGDKVHGAIDWARRYSLMRYHTTVHLIDGIVEKDYGAGGITGGAIFPDRARIDFSLDALNRELAQKIIDRANVVSAEAHPVSSRIITRDEALAMPNLARTEPGRELIMSMPEVRIVEIEGVDLQSDGGLHVANTREIGAISLKSFENKGKRSKRIEITLGDLH